MSIIRVSKHDSNFVVLDKTFINDDRLSWKAKGILTYLLSKPDGWNARVRDLMSKASDGRDSCYAGLKELERIGYLRRFPVRGASGKITGYESVVYEYPFELETIVKSQVELLPAFPDTAKPDTAKPDTENPEHNKYRNKQVMTLARNDPKGSDVCTTPFGECEGDVVAPLKATQHPPAKCQGEEGIPAIGSLLSQLRSLVAPAKLNKNLRAFVETCDRSNVLEAIERLREDLDDRPIENPIGYFRAILDGLEGRSKKMGDRQNPKQQDQTDQCATASKITKAPVSHPYPIEGTGDNVVCPLPTEPLPAWEPGEYAYVWLGRRNIYHLSIVEGYSGEDVAVRLLDRNQTKLLKKYELFKPKFA